MTEADELQIGSHEQWVWNRESHWKNWHGIWQLWDGAYPGQKPTKLNRVIRALRADNEDGTRLFHRNQWFTIHGEHQWEFGPWIMNEETHSLANGIVHPNKDNFRILQFPNGDLGWLQLEVTPDDPKTFVFGEVHFMLPGKNGRIPIIVGYNKQSEPSAAQMLEEAKDTDVKLDDSWNGDVFDHKVCIDKPLDEGRAEPEGTFVGTEMELTVSLKLTTTKVARWTGFTGGLSEDEYMLLHMPLGFTVCLRKRPAIGQEHDFLVHWLVKDDNVRMISWKYGQDGKLIHIKSGTYERRQ